VGTINRLGGTINLTGQMNNAGVTFTLDSAKGDWRLVGGKIVGGTIASAEGAKLVYTTSGGTLDGITSDADMDLTTTQHLQLRGQRSHAQRHRHVRQQRGAVLPGNRSAGARRHRHINSTDLGLERLQLQQHAAHRSDILVHGPTATSAATAKATLINDGTIDSDGAGTMSVGTVTAWTNAGTIGAHNSCTSRCKARGRTPARSRIDSTSTLNLAALSRRPTSARSAAPAVPST
jgi:hypothetical protein